MGIARHLFHYRSALDASPQPYLVCAPDAPADGPLPVVFWLHDTLADPTPNGFIEESFRQAASWLPALTAAEPCLFVQPFGRGNAAFLGLGARDLFDVLAAIQKQFACDADAVSIGGVGAGATGALLLASWHPDLFAGVAAIGAWADAKLDLPLGASNWPEWERPQRDSLDPLGLIENLERTPVYVEHPSWFLGQAGRPDRRHFESLTRRLKRAGVPFTLGPEPNPLRIERQCPADPAALLGWLLSKRQTASNSFRFRSYGVRFGRRQDVWLGERSDPAKPAVVEVHRTASELAIKTTGVDAVAVKASVLHSAQVRMDRKVLAVSNGKPGSERHWVRFDRLDKQWAAAEQVLADPWRETAERRTISDAHFDPMLFVPGTLGDELENEQTRQLALTLANRLQSGVDSLNPLQADRTLSFAFPIIHDHEVSDAQLQSGTAVLIGTPRTNLVLARLRARLSCRWLDGSDERAFEVNGTSYAGALEAAFVCCPNPDRPRGSVLVVTANSPAGYAHAGRVRTAYLPSFLVFRVNKVLDWG